MDSGESLISVSGQKFVRIEQSLRIERRFDGAVHRPRNAGRRLQPPPLLRQPHPVLTSDYAAPGEHLREELIQRPIHLRPHVGRR